MDILVNLGYWIAGLGALLCIVAYFILPGLIRKTLGADSEKEED